MEQEDTQKDEFKKGKLNTFLHLDHCEQNPFVSRTTHFYIFVHVID